jgi:hypothetical protein
MDRLLGKGDPLANSTVGEIVNVESGKKGIKHKESNIKR